MTPHEYALAATAADLVMWSAGIIAILGVASSIADAVRWLRSY